jgi:hypothetical protein
MMNQIIADGSMTLSREWPLHNRSEDGGEDVQDYERPKLTEKPEMSWDRTVCCVSRPRKKRRIRTCLKS